MILSNLVLDVDSCVQIPAKPMNATACVCKCAVGVVEIDNVTLLELEDVAKRYRHPSIIDIKLGFRTWYPTADQRYIDKCKAKDASTTQAALGFKICGMQVKGHAEMCLHSTVVICCSAGLHQPPSVSLTAAKIALTDPDVGILSSYCKAACRVLHVLSITRLPQACECLMMGV